MTASKKEGRSTSHTILKERFKLKLQTHEKVIQGKAKIRGCGREQIRCRKNHREIDEHVPLPTLCKVPSSYRCHRTVGDGTHDQRKATELYTFYPKQIYAKRIRPYFMLPKKKKVYKDINKVKIIRLIEDGKKNKYNSMVGVSYRYFCLKGNTCPTSGQNSLNLY